MTDRIPTRAGAVLLAATAVTGHALALRPDEVLVVGNRSLPDSAALAKYYAARRGMADRNVLLLTTTRGETISREDYDREIRDPIRRALADRKLQEKVRCLCLMWGVPVRVSAPTDAAHETAWAVTRRARQKLHYRLVIDCKLLGTVGRTFPAPRTKDLKPIGYLFASPLPVPPEPLPAVAQLTRDVRKLLATKQVEIDKIRDARRRGIATRQLLALHLDLRGLGGLIEHLRDHPSPLAPKAAELQDRLDQANRRIAQVRRSKVRGETVGELLGLMDRTGGVIAAAAYAEKLYGQMRKVHHIVKSEAAVDSELALLWWRDYPLPGPIRNPLHWRSRAATRPNLPRAMMACRIDGPSRADALRIIKASIAAEAKGLRGVFYVDAGGPTRVAATARQRYDKRLKDLYQFARTHTKLQTVLDEKPTVFPKGSCPRAALYVGWYSLRKYVPAFTWTPGAVGWHVASWEAVHLRDADSREWCPQMIRNGVAATLGAVGEPLLTQFPNPEELFPLLLTGQYTIAECYWRTIPAASWQMTLIADPLYNPFRANPQVQAKILPPGLAP